MKFPSYLKRSIYSGFTFFLTVLILSIGYGALNGGLSLSDKVGTGSGLTVSSWNKIIDGILDLDTRTAPISSTGGKVSIGAIVPDATLAVQGTLKSGNSWARNLPTNTTFPTSAETTLSTLTFTCHGGPILIFGNFDNHNAIGWSNSTYRIRVDGTTVRAFTQTSTLSSSYGNFSVIIQTLYNCTAGVHIITLTGHTGNNLTTYVQNIEFSAAELGMR